MVKILYTLTFTRYAERSAESVGLSSFCTCLFVKEKFNEYHGSIKPYHLLHGSASNVVRTGPFVNGNKPKLTPGRSETP
jgi:hypothetical protein